MGGIEQVAGGISDELRRRLPGQRKTQREALALLVATMLQARSANLMEVAAALPRPVERIDMRYQWVVRVLANPLIGCDAVMAPFAREVLARAASAGRVEVILDQSKLSDRHQVLMLALRWGERALPLAWRVEQTAGPIGLPQQLALLDLLAAWLPEGATVLVLADRFYGTPGLVSACAVRGWDYRLRLKGNLRVFVPGKTGSAKVGDLVKARPCLTGVELTGQRVPTNIGAIHDPGHTEPWIVAMSDTPGYLSTLDYSKRWASSRCSRTSSRAASAWTTRRSGIPTASPGSCWSWRWPCTWPCPPGCGIAPTTRCPPKPRPGAGHRASSRAALSRASPAVCAASPASCSKQPRFPRSGRRRGELIDGQDSHH